MRPLRILGRPAWQLEEKHLNGGAPAWEFSRLTDNQRAKVDRNTLIGLGHRLGMSQVRIARALGLSKAQVNEIVNRLEGWRTTRPADDED